MKKMFFKQLGFIFTACTLLVILSVAMIGVNAEAEKESKKARQGDRKKPMVCKFDSSKKKKPANESKSTIVSNVISTLEQMGATEITIANPEREFTFQIEGVKYKFVLSVPRS
mgnify:CR=1 FL=1